MSRGFYLGTLGVLLSVGGLLPMVAVLGLSVFGGWQQQMSSPVALLVLVGTGVLMGVAASVIMLMLVYKMWAAIQDRQVRMSPGLAGGLLFVPLFNLYWIFRVFRGFAQDFNAFAERHAIETPSLSTALFTAYSVLTLLSAVPLVGLVNYFVALAMVSAICGAVNAIPPSSAAATRSTV